MCQGGTKIRRRQVTTASKYGGTECPKLEESRTCNTRLCTLQDRRKCSHIKCKYRAHTAARERAVFNFPETVRPFHDKGAGHQWHVGVMHDVNEKLGGKHHCYNVGHYEAGTGSADGKGGWEQVKEGQRCECVCWGQMLHQRPGYDPTSSRYSGKWMLPGINYHKKYWTDLGLSS